ncbi:MAG: hypothetical protein FJX71_04590 [Alphaproteobacteria bacterium]|nr:hypothetical protein [Alphaproteobacteria bacterium]
MNTVLKLGIVVAFCYLLVPSAFAGENAKSDLKNNLDGYNLQLLFPINVLGDKGARTNLKIQIPKGFRCLQKDQLLSGNYSLLEFIPEKDDENQWSEIITVNLFVGKSAQASKFNSYLKDRMVQAAEESKILEDNVTQGESFETAVLTLAYKHNGRREVVLVKTFSGPMDCVSVQYAVALKEGQTEDEAFKKVKAWMEDSQNLKPFKF